MGKRKSGRGGRGGRHDRGHDARKQSCFDPTLDTEMLDAPHQHGERYNNNNQKKSIFQTQHENNTRRRVGKSARNNSQTPQVTVDQGSLSNVIRGRQSSTRANPSTSAFSSRNPFVNPSRTKNRRASIGTCISALSTQVGRGSYCYKCTQTNRKLREALLGLLERALKDGKNLIDEWAWEAGVSPDHMDCERTKLHIVPEEGLQCENEPCNKCQAEVSNPNQSHRVDLSPPQFLCAPGVSSSRLPPSRIHQPVVGQLQQKVQAAPGAVERQLPPLPALQFSSARPWNVLSTMSMAEQPAAFANFVGYHGQVPQAQAQQNIEEQQEREPDSIHVWQVANGNHYGPTHQHPVQESHQQAEVDDIGEQARIDSYVLNSVNQEHHYGNVYMPTQQTHSVEDAPSGPTLQAQQYPFQHLQHPSSDRGEHSGTTLADAAGPALEEEHNTPLEAQSRQQANPNALARPPPSNNMTIPDILITASGAQSEPHKEISVDVGISIEATPQGTKESPDNVLDPDAGQGQSSLHRFSEQEQQLAEKYCCEVIPIYALQQ